MSNNLVHLIFDIETLGMRENTVILSLACVPFTFEEHECFEVFLTRGFFVKFDVKDQLKNLKRTMSPATIDWWKTQSKDAREMNLLPTEGDVTLFNGLNALSRFIEKTDYNYKQSYVFSRGTYFDFPKMEHAYEVSCGLPVPFNTWKIRDVRTFIDIFAGVNDGSYDVRFCKTDSFIKHDPLHDAAMDACRLNELYYITMENPAF